MVGFRIYFKGKANHVSPCGVWNVREVIKDDSIECLFSCCCLALFLLPKQLERYGALSEMKQIKGEVGSGSHFFSCEFPCLLKMCVYM